MRAVARHRRLRHPLHACTRQELRVERALSVVRKVDGSLPTLRGPLRRREGANDYIYEQCDPWSDGERRTMVRPAALASG